MSKTPLQCNPATQKGKILKIVTPVPPSENHAFYSLHGRRIMNNRGREWIAEAKRIAEHECKRQGWVCTEGQKVICDIMTYFPDHRKRDVSNGIKVYADAFEEVIYDNDRYLLPRYINYEVDKESPRTEAIFRLYDEEKDTWLCDFREQIKDFKKNFNTNAGKTKKEKEKTKK